MKVILKYLFVFIVVSATSCDKNDFQPDYSNGQATAIMNGENWIGQGRGYSNVHGIGIDANFTVYDNLGQERQNISFRKIPRSVGVYNVFNTSGQSTDSISGCTFRTLTQDGDVVEDVYRVVETGEQSTIKVTDYRSSNRLISGEFSLKLYIDPDRPKSNPSNPDTILFEMGEFEVKIEE